MKNIKIVDKKINKNELKNMAEEMFGDLVKAVVDIEKEIMALGGEMHVDEEQILLEQGSKQENLWGINFYPNLTTDFIEFDSMINIRPRQNNRSRDIENQKIKDKIIQVVNKLVE